MFLLCLHRCVKEEVTFFTPSHLFQTGRAPGSVNYKRIHTDLNFQVLCFFQGLGVFFKDLNEMDYTCWMVLTGTPPRHLSVQYFLFLENSVKRSGENFANHGSIKTTDRPECRRSIDLKVKDPVFKLDNFPSSNTGFKRRFKITTSATSQIYS